MWFLWHCSYNCQQYCDAVKVSGIYYKSNLSTWIHAWPRFRKGPKRSSIYSFIAEWHVFFIDIINFNIIEPNHENHIRNVLLYDSLVECKSSIRPLKIAQKTTARLKTETDFLISQNGGQHQVKTEIPDIQSVP